MLVCLHNLIIKIRQCKISVRQFDVAQVTGRKRINPADYEMVI